jgi:purine-binding chemotaxis protein CheW
VVEFLLAGEHYAIESTAVREVHPLRELTPLPCTPPFVLGIMNVRGQIMAVVDLRRFFDLPLPDLTDLNKVVILRSGNMELGILADAVIGVRVIPRQEIQPPPPTFTGLRADYLHGVTVQGLIVLDAGRIAADGRIVVHEEVEN